MSHARPNYAARLSRLRTARGDKCELCSVKLRWRLGPNGDKVPNLQFAHKAETPISYVSRGRGRAERYYDIKRHPECYQLLCVGCHAKTDLKVLCEAARDRAKNGGD